MNIEITDYETELILTSLITASAQASRSADYLEQHGSADSAKNYLKVKADATELYRKILDQTRMACPVCGTQHTTKEV